MHAEIYQNNLIYFRISIIISRKRSNILPSGEKINMKTCKDAAKEKRPLPADSGTYRALRRGKLPGCPAGQSEAASAPGAGA